MGRQTQAVPTWVKVGLQLQLVPLNVALGFCKHYCYARLLTGTYIAQAESHPSPFAVFPSSQA